VFEETFGNVYVALGAVGALNTKHEPMVNKGGPGWLESTTYDVENLGIDVFVAIAQGNYAVAESGLEVLDAQGHALW
jgi:hypothetical protein